MLDNLKINAAMRAVNGDDDGISACIASAFNI